MCHSNAGSALVWPAWSSEEQYNCERHIVFECPALHDLRARCDSLFRPSISTMRQFMWQDDLVQVAQFIRLSLGRVYNGLDTVDM